jgi:hypothetical protein
MKSISLKLSEELLEDSGNCAEALDLSRAQYIRRAIEKMNKETIGRFKAERMAEASFRVREESMRVNAEFAAIEEDLDD